MLLKFLSLEFKRQKRLMSAVCPRESNPFCTHHFLLLCCVPITSSLQNSTFTLPVSAYGHLSCSVGRLSHATGQKILLLMTLATSYINFGTIHRQKQFLAWMMPYVLNIFVSSIVSSSKCMSVLCKDTLDKKMNKVLQARSANSKSAALSFHCSASALGLVQKTATCSQLMTILSTMSGTAGPSLQRVGEISEFRAAQGLLLGNQEASLGGGPS